MLNKLYRLGIRGLPHCLIKSYFEERLHFTSIGNENSSYCPSRIGTIQGSNLRPLFYIIYANELNGLFSLDIDTTMFADDTVISICREDLIYFNIIMNVIINKLMDWSNFNKLYIIFKC